MQIHFINPKLEKYLLSFEKSTVSKLTKLIDLLEVYGNKLGMPYSKQVKNNLYELRIRGQQEIRVFYCFYQNKIVFVHAFIKKSQKTPQRDMDTATLRIKQLTGI